MNSQSTVQPTMGELWHHLADQGLVQGDLPTLDDSGSRATPWYVAGLVGIAGWVAAAFLIVFLGLINLIDSRSSMLVIGGAFCLAALGIKYIRHEEIFSSQLAFALSLAGQGLIIGSQFDSSSVFQIVVTVLMVEGLLFLLYPDGLHRLISFFAIVAAVAVQMADWSVEAYFPLLVLLLAGAGLWIWYQHLPLRASWMGAYFKPLSLGLPIAALGLCFLQLTNSGLTDGPWWGAGLGMGMMLLILGRFVLQELDLPIFSAAGAIMLIAVVILMVPSYKTPGVMAAMLVLALGFWRKEHILTGIGVAGFGLFISFYYYNLELTLLVKSFVLIGSGAALLICRLISNRYLGFVEPEEVNNES